MLPVRAQVRSHNRSVPARLFKTRGGGRSASRAVRSAPVQSELRYWRCLNMRLGGVADAERVRLWKLVLEAKRIPYMMGAQPNSLYVSALYEEKAFSEIHAFESEPMERDAAPASVVHENWLAGLLFFAALIFLDFLRHSEDTVFSSSFVDAWVTAGSLQGEAIVHDGEWWRVFTALTLHADAAHLLGNCLFGALFLLPLCRFTGFGHGLFCCVYGGALGNAATVLFRHEDVSSLGFSSAVFATLGGLAAYGALRSIRFIRQKGRPRGGIRRAVWAYPLCAALALLAFLGAGGDTPAGVDVTAHAFGFCVGILIWSAIEGINTFCLAFFKGRRDGSRFLFPLSFSIFTHAPVPERLPFDVPFRLWLDFCLAVIALGSLAASWGICWKVG